MRQRRKGAVAWVLLVAVMTLVSACSAGFAPTPWLEDLSTDHVLIVEVYPNGFDPNGADQFIRLFNPTQQAVDLTGWQVGDLVLQSVFPQNASIGPGETLYVAESAEGFRQVMGALPDFQWGVAGDETLVPVLEGEHDLVLGREQGAVVLRRPTGDIVDMVAYGQLQSTQMSAWKGPPASAPGAGEILDRARDEAAWGDLGPVGYARDTDTAADWKQGTAWVDARVLRPGQTWFGYPTYCAQQVTAYASPDSAYRTVAELLDGARESVDLNLYDFTLTPIADKLAEASRRGVKVRLLLDAGSSGEPFDQERHMARIVAEAGGEVRWNVHSPKHGIHGRYVFNHAKYGVIDGRVSFVQSENMVRHGVPVDPSFGNRGWGVVVDDKPLAAYLSRVFEADWSPVYGDVRPYQPGTAFGPPDPGFKSSDSIPQGNYPHPFPALTIQRPVPVTPVLAPEHTLLSSKGIIGLMRSAQESLLIQQQYIHLFWGPNDGGPKTTPDLFLQEAIEAARRGVKVRILLSDSFLDPKKPRDNTRTVEYVNDLAQAEGLDLEARIVDSKRAGFDKIHNKGILVDHRKVYVGSVNWSYNSPANNREVGLIIEDPEIAGLYVDLFTYDWFDGSPSEEGLYRLHLGKDTSTLLDWDSIAGLARAGCGR